MARERYFNHRHLHEWNILEAGGLENWFNLREGSVRSSRTSHFVCAVMENFNFLSFIILFLFQCHAIIIIAAASSASHVRNTTFFNFIIWLWFMNSILGSQSSHNLKEILLSSFRQLRNWKRKNQFLPLKVASKARRKRKLEQIRSAEN